MKTRHLLGVIYSLLLIPCCSTNLVAQPPAVPQPAGAQNAGPITEPSEIWVGNLDVGAAKLRLQLNLVIDAEGTVTEAQLFSLDQTSTPIPIDKALRTPDRLGFVITPLGLSYQGSVDPSGQKSSGEFIQQGRKFELELRKSEQAVKIDHQSTWTGKFTLGPQAYDFQFRIFQDNFGALSAKLDSFTEGVWGIPCEFERNEQTFTFRNGITQGEFVGTLSADQSTLEGAWNQAGQSIPFTLQRVPLEQTRETKFNRPQTPLPPFPYTQKGFRVVVNEIDPQYEGNVGIAGTLTLPTREGEASDPSGPFPLVILISGTGQQDRDSSFFEHRPYAIVADHLARQGYAVIRFDDRGIGQSVGNTNQATLLNYANDAEAIYRWAKQLPEIDSKRIVLLGHSEGATIASMISMRQPDIAGIILLSGLGLSGRQVFVSQTVAIAKASGIPEDIVNRQEQFLNQVFLEAKQAAIELPRVQELFQQHFSTLSDREKLEYGLRGVPENTFALLRSPWITFFLDYDPRTALAYVKRPILSLFGEKDLQTIPQLHAPSIQSAVEIAQNLDFEQQIFPGLNHMFQPAESGSPREYHAIETTIAPVVLETITNWLNRRFQ